MSIVNQRWNQRVEAHKIWASLMDAVNKKNPSKKETKPVNKSKPTTNSNTTKPIHKPIERPVAAPVAAPVAVMKDPKLSKSYCYLKTLDC